MESLQNEKDSVGTVRGRCVVQAMVAVALVFSSCLPIASARPQTPVKQDQAVQAQEKAPEQPMDKKHLAEVKAQAQQKQLADDTAKLLVLANELKADMDKTTKDTLSLAVVKKAEEVEKLAHKVRDEMKASLGN